MAEAQGPMPVSDLPVATLEKAWLDYQKHASLLAQYAKSLRERILDGKVIIGVPEVRSPLQEDLGSEDLGARSPVAHYVRNKPRQFAEVSLFVAERRRIDLYKRNKEDKQERDDARRRDGLDIPHDERTSEQAVVSEKFEYIAIPLHAWARRIRVRGISLLSGGPGSGKTYLSLMATASLCDEYQGANDPVPILCTAENLLRNLRSAHLMSFGNEAAGFDFNSDGMRLGRCILEACKTTCGAEMSDRVEDRLLEAIVSGSATLILDAVDQASQQYTYVCALLARFNEFSQCGILITGRPYAFGFFQRYERLAKWFETARWNARQIRQYCQAVNLDSENIDRLSQMATNRTSAESVAVPQLLAFCAELYSANRATTLDIATISRTQLFDRIFAQRTRRVIGDTGSPLQDANSRNALRQQLAKASLIFWKENVGKDVGRVSSRQIGKGNFEELAELGWVANVATDDDFTFVGEWSHRSVLEYLVGIGAADAILQKQSIKEQLSAVSRLATWGFDPECREVLRFAFGRLASDNKPLAEFLLAELSDPDKDDGGKTRLSVAALLSHDALETQVPLPSCASIANWARMQTTLYKIDNNYKLSKNNNYESPIGVTSHEFEKTTQHLLIHLDKQKFPVGEINALVEMGDPSVTRNVVDAVSSYWDDESNWESSAVNPIRRGPSLSGTFERQIVVLGGPLSKRYVQSEIQVALKSNDLSTFGAAIRELSICGFDDSDPEIQALLVEVFVRKWTSHILEFATVLYEQGFIQAGNVAAHFLCDNIQKKDSRALYDLAKAVKVFSEVIDPSCLLGAMHREARVPLNAAILASAVASWLSFDEAKWLASELWHAVERHEWALASMFADLLAETGYEFVAQTLSDAYIRALGGKNFDVLEGLQGSIVKLGEPKAIQQLLEHSKTILHHDLRIPGLKFTDNIGGELVKAFAYHATKGGWQGCHTILSNILFHLAEFSDYSRNQMYENMQLAMQERAMKKDNATRNVEFQLNVDWNNWMYEVVKAQLRELVGAREFLSKSPFVQHKGLAASTGPKIIPEPMSWDDLRSNPGKTVRKLDDLKRKARNGNVATIKEEIELSPFILELRSTSFQLFHSLMQVVPRSEPRHWIGSKFVTTESIIRWDI